MPVNLPSDPRIWLISGLDRKGRYRCCGRYRYLSIVRPVHRVLASIADYLCSNLFIFLYNLIVLSLFAMLNKE